MASAGSPSTVTCFGGERMAGSADRRAISPVIGTVLLVAIVAIMAALAAYVIFGAAETHDPAPAVSVELVETENPAVYRLRYRSGEATLENRTELQGVIESDALHGTELGAGDEIEVMPVSNEVRLVWEGDDRTYTLQTFEAEPAPGLEDISSSDIDYDCDWAEEHINDQQDLDLNSGEVLRCDILDDIDLDPGVSGIDPDIYANATLIGSIDTDGDVNLDQATVTGDVTTDGNDIVMTGESTVYGDVVAQVGTNIDIDGDSYMAGAVVARDGSLSLSDVTVDGHVYVDESDFSCSGDTELGPDSESCSEYDPRDPGDY